MELLTVDETARLLKVTPITVRRYIADGRLPAFKVGRRVRVRKEAVEQLLSPIEPTIARAGRRETRPVKEREQMHPTEQPDIWADYDLKRVRAALAASAGAFRGIDAEQLKADIAAAREQDSSGASCLSMPYLIDTDWVIDHLDDHPEARALLERLAPDGIAISIVTYMEAYQGVARSPDPEEAEALFRVFVDSLPVLPFSTAVAERCARLRETLRLAGRQVSQRALDLIKAATALEHGLTLVTRNRDDYRDIPGLQRFEEDETAP